MSTRAVRPSRSASRLIGRNSVSPQPEQVEANTANTLLNGAPSPRDEMFFYRGHELYAYRYKEFKMHMITQGSYGMPPKRAIHDDPLLYHLERDPGEQWEVQEEFPDVLDEMVKRVEAHRNSFEHAESVFDRK